MPYLGILGQEFLKRPLSYLKINTLKFVYLQTFVKKQKCLNLGPVPYLGNFGLEL